MNDLNTCMFCHFCSRKGCFLHTFQSSLRWLWSLETFSCSRLAGSPMIGVKDILMNVRVHFRGPCSVQTTGVAHLMGLWNPDTLSSPPLSSCSRGLRRLINVNVFSLLKPIRCTLSGHAQQNITLFRRTAAPPLPSLTPQQSRLSKSRGRLAFGRDWPSRYHSAPPCLTYSLIFDHSVARHLLFRAEMSLGRLVSSQTPRPDKRFYFGVLQGRKYWATVLMHTNCQLAIRATWYWFNGHVLRHGKWNLAWLCMIHLLKSSWCPTVAWWRISLHSSHLISNKVQKAFAC